MKKLFELPGIAVLFACLVFTLTARTGHLPDSGVGQNEIGILARVEILEKDLATTTTSLTNLETNVRRRQNHYGYKVIVEESSRIKLELTAKEPKDLSNGDSKKKIIVKDAQPGDRFLVQCTISAYPETTGFNLFVACHATGVTHDTSNPWSIAGFRDAVRTEGIESITQISEVTAEKTGQLEFSILAKSEKNAVVHVSGAVITVMPLGESR